MTDPATLWATSRPVVVVSSRTRPGFWFRPTLADTPADRKWLKSVCGPRSRPTWNADARHWQVAAPHMERVLIGTVKRFRHCDVLLESVGIEKCTRGCQDANPDTWMDCMCPCNGQYHGGGGSGWRQVGEYLLVRVDSRTFGHQPWDGHTVLTHITRRLGIGYRRAS